MSEPTKGTPEGSDSRGAARGLEKTPWIVGGNIPRQDHEALLRLGARGIFPTGTPFGAIVAFLRQEVRP